MQARIIYKNVYITDKKLFCSGPIFLRQHKTNFSVIVFKKTEVAKLADKG